MQLEDSELYLQGFAPLIQLWAGICLLFFYESLLNKSPFTSLCVEIRTLYDDFKNQYNMLIPLDVVGSDEYVKDHWSNNFVPTIKCVASLCFFYSAFVLAFIGIEANESLGGVYYCALQVMNTVVWLYLIAALLLYKKKIFHGFISSIVLSILLLEYFHFHFGINDFCSSFFNLGSIWSKSHITIYTVFTCISGVFLVCFRLFISWFVLQCQKKSVNNIYKEFRVFADYNLGKIKRDALPKKKLGRIMKRCTEKFSNGEISAIDAKAFLDAMKDEVAKEYRDFTKRWWIRLY